MAQFSMEEALQNFLKNSKLKGGIHAVRIEEVWEEIMGKTIATYTSQIKIIKGTLFISTQVAPLKQELMYQKDLIIARVNEALGEEVIQEVVINWFPSFFISFLLFNPNSYLIID